MEQFCDFPEIRRLTGKSDPTIRKMIARGELPKATHRRGARIYWLRADVDAALAKPILPVLLTPEPADSPK